MVQFVRVKTQPHCQKGIGKVIHQEGNLLTIEWFIMPGGQYQDPITETAEIPEREVEFLTKLEKQQRVYWKNRIATAIGGSTQNRPYIFEGGQWCVGLVADDGGVSLPLNDELYVRIIDSVSPHDYYERIQQRYLKDIYVRSTIAHKEAHEYAAKCWAENPKLGRPRVDFRKEFIEQRGLFRGMTGLASSNIKMFDYQIDVVQHILNSPVQRFILGDEVGLGKTVETLAILRQYFLDGHVNHMLFTGEDRQRVEKADSSPKLRCLIVVPKTLMHQWKEEIDLRINLGYMTRDLDKIKPDMDEFICVIPYEDIAKAEKQLNVNTIVVDEVHLLCGEDRENEYNTLHRMSQQDSNNRILLLSATPIVDNLDGYFKMLSVLDPATYPLDNDDARDNFDQRFKKREQIAKLWRDLDDSFGKSKRTELLGLFPDEPTITSYINELGTLQSELRTIERILGQGGAEQDTVSLERDRKEKSKRKRNITKELKFLLGEIGRLDTRIIRNQRQASQPSNVLATRAGARTIKHQCERRTNISSFLNQWHENLDDEKYTNQSIEWVLFKKMLACFFEDPKTVLEYACAEYDALSTPFKELIGTYSTEHNDHREPILQRDGRWLTLFESIQDQYSAYGSVIVFVPETVLNEISNFNEAVQIAIPEIKEGFLQKYQDIVNLVVAAEQPPEFLLKFPAILENSLLAGLEELTLVLGQCLDSELISDEIKEQLVTYKTDLEGQREQVINYTQISSFVKTYKLQTCIDTFQKDGGVLFCTKNFEAGINLHQRKSAIIMYDLPFDIGRVEQRIGRIDRLGSQLAGEELSVTVFEAETDLDQEWVSLIQATEVFTNSISPIQNQLAQEIEKMWDILNSQGVSIAGTILNVSEDIKENVKFWHNKVKMYDALSMIRSFDKEYKTVRQAIVDDTNRNVWSKIESWTKELVFLPSKLTDDKHAFQYYKNTPNTKRNRMEQKKQCTLLPRSFLTSSPSIKAHLKYQWIHKEHDIVLFDRKHLPNRQKFYKEFAEGSRILRIGCPLLELLNQVCLLDDRGVSVAYTKPATSKLPKGVYFNLHILLEGSIGSNTDSSWRRNLDYFIPPTMHSIWIDHEGKIVENQEDINYLNEVDEKKNVLTYKPTAWTLAIKDVGYKLSEWPDRVQGVVKKAKEHIAKRAEPELKKSKERIEHFYTHKVQVMKARDEKGQVEKLELEKKLLLKQAESPTFFCDGIQTVFLK